MRIRIEIGKTLFFFLKRKKTDQNQGFDKSLRIFCSKIEASERIGIERGETGSTVVGGWESGSDKSLFFLKEQT